MVLDFPFQAIEQPEEKTRIVEYNRNTRKPINRYLKNVLELTTQNIDTLNETSIKRMLKKIQKETEDQNSLISTMQQLMEGDISAEPLTPRTGNWGLASSIFFSLTIVSTIGYGSFTAQTKMGKTFTVLLAIFGVSYFGYCLSIVGERVLYTLEYTLNRFILGISLEEITKQQRRLGDKHNEINFKLFAFLFAICMLYILSFAGLAHYFEPTWGFDNSVYFAIISFTTVGLGDFYPTPTAETGDGERLGGYFFFAVLLLIGLALVSAIIAAVTDAAEVFKRIAKKRLIAYEQKMEKSIKRRLTSVKSTRNAHKQKKYIQKLDKKTKPDYVMSDKERNQIKGNILKAIRKDCGAGSDAYRKCVEILDSIEKYRLKTHIGKTHVVELEEDVKILCKQSPNATHEFVVYILNFIHNMTIETDEKEAEDVVWELRIKRSIGFGAFVAED